MKKILFASNNKHKIEEISRILEGFYTIISPVDIGCTDDIPETGFTLQENALQKAQYIFDRYGVSCFADDTGLEIDALNGAPGVFSARFAGEGVTYKQNRDKVMQLLKDEPNRKARFRTVIALILNGQTYFFEGACNGEITLQERGEGEFGYDPIFLPQGYTDTFAEMTAELKNNISHRGLAVQKLAAFLKETII